MEMRSLIPAYYRAPEWQAAFEQQIIVNWLDLEVDWRGPQTVAEEEALGQLRGWRNREVRAYIVINAYTERMFGADAEHKRLAELDHLKQWAAIRKG